MDARNLKVYTMEDIENLPDGERAELIDGKIYNMSAPSRRHQELVGRFNQLIANYIELNNGNCKVYPAPFAVFLNADDKTYVEPDIVVVCDPDKLTDKGCNGAPDWIIEIVSPSSKYMDYLRKANLYESAGVTEYWIADPDKELITVYNFEEKTMEQYPFGTDVPSGLYDGFCIKVE